MKLFALLKLFPLFQCQSYFPDEVIRPVEVIPLVEVIPTPRIFVKLKKSFEWFRCEWQIGEDFFVFIRKSEMLSSRKKNILL